MPTINITKTYEDGTILFQSDLDNIVDDITSFLNTTKIDNSNIQDGGIDGSLKLTTASVVESKLASAAVTTSKIADDAVTTAKILAANVTTAKIADSNVTTAKIADSNVTTAKIADSNVTTAKLANGAVTPVKITQNYSISSATSFSTTSGSYVAVTNASTSITTVGSKLIEIKLIPDSSGAGFYSTGSGFLYRIKRDSTVIAEVVIVSGSSTSPLNVIDVNPAAGTYTYSLEVSADVFGGTISVLAMKMLVIEL